MRAHRIVSPMVSQTNLTVIVYVQPRPQSPPSFLACVEKIRETGDEASDCTRWTYKFCPSSNSHLEVSACKYRAVLPQVTLQTS